MLGPDVSVDVCPECSGEYLDDGEIKRLAGDGDVHGLLVSYATHVAESELVCPNCEGRMDAHRLDIGTDTTSVDICTKCHGVWLDDGELGKLQAAGTEHEELDSDELAEIWDGNATEARRKHLLGQLLGGLRRQ